MKGVEFFVFFFVVGFFFWNGEIQFHVFLKTLATPGCLLENLEGLESSRYCSDPVCVVHV